MNIKEYQNKVKACWTGKNIGGSLGAPMECKRGVWDLDFYTADLSKGALPNDDLDLQLVWLNAAEKYGKMVNSEILGEYWISYITGNWSEYGAGKNNMSFGLIPPISGWYHNQNKDSCGCFIRSEIWACLMPGHPQLAVKYAYEDAICDHADEGVYAEIFCTALESAAFVIDNTYELINVALSYIPKECAVAGAVRTAIECYKKGINWKEARKQMLRAFPCSFGMYCGYEDRPEEDLPIGQLGFDAPCNVGIIIIGWLYGEGDFGKSLCIAAGCGEDGDCTAATLGSVLGIIGGMEVIPEKWIEPIGEDIVTISIDLTNDLISIPKTVDELTHRVCNLMPVFMNSYFELLGNEGISISMAENLFDIPEQTGVFNKVYFAEKLLNRGLGITKSNVLYEVTVSFQNGISIQNEVEKKLTISIKNKLKKQQWLTAKWYLPETWSANPCIEQCIYLDQAHGGNALTETAFSIIPNQLNKGRYDVLLEISSLGRLSRLYFPIVFVVDNYI